MPTERQQKLVKWLRNRKVASIKQMTRQFQLSQPTIFRYLKQYGYLTSYNHNAAYYTLLDLPQFDQHGLWAYRDIRFSKFGNLADTIIALVQNEAQGMTAQELQQRLQTNVVNLLARLVQKQRLAKRTLAGRKVLYLAIDPRHAQRQFQQRQDSLAQTAAEQAGQLLPPGLHAQQVIPILRQMVVAPHAQPETLARQLATSGIAITAGQIRRVIQHYALEKKRHSTSSG